jgi:hypothetical protein
MTGQEFQSFEPESLLTPSAEEGNNGRVLWPAALDRWEAEEGGMSDETDPFLQALAAEAVEQSSVQEPTLMAKALPPLNQPKPEASVPAAPASVPVLPAVPLAPPRPKLTYSESLVDDMDAFEAGLMLEEARFLKRSIDSLVSRYFAQNEERGGQSAY